MRDWFFYQERGKTMGPLTADDLRARIRDGRIKLFDLIFKEGESGWKMAMEHPDLRDEFKKPAAAGLKDRPWVCLHRKSEESFEFITLGPYSTGELKDAIQEGRISYNDYAWKAAYLEWKRLGAIEEFNARAATPAKSSDAPTVMVPVSSSPTGANAQERRPAPVHPDLPAEAVALLKNVVEFRRGGKIAEPEPPPKDAGSDDLTKIVPTTSPRKVDPPFDPDATRVVTIQRPSVNSSGAPPPPPRAQFNDSPNSRSDSRSDSRPVARPAAPPVGASKPESARTPTPPAPVTDEPRGAGADAAAEGEVLLERRRKKRRSSRQKKIWTDWGIVGSLSVILLVVIGLIVRRLGHRPVPVPPQVMQSVESQSPSGGGDLTPPNSSADGVGNGNGAGATAAPANDLALGATPPAGDFSPPAPPKLNEQDTVPAGKTADGGKDEEGEDNSTDASKSKGESREPTQLVLNVQNVSGNQARIDIRSNGSAEFPVYVQVIGLPGQVADGASFYRYMRLKPSGNVAKPLDLSQLKLPAGRFVIHAETGKLRKDASINLGTGDSSYRQSVAKVRKSAAAAIWRERLDLYKTSLRLEGAVGQAVTAKRISAKGLEGLAQVKKANGANFIFFEEWWELKQIFSEAKERATPAVLDRAKRQREKIASLSVWRPK